METTIYHPDRGKKKVFDQEKLNAHINAGWSITKESQLDTLYSRLETEKIDKRSKAYRDSNK